MLLSHVKSSFKRTHPQFDDMHPGSMLVIDLPQKIWQKKVDCAFKIPVHDDIDDGVFEFQSHGKCVFRSHNAWKQG